MTAEQAPPALLDHAFLADLAEAIGMDGTIEVIGLFREDGPKRVVLMRAHIPHDPARVRREAHALAGAARNIGLVRLGEAALALQHKIERTEPEPSDVAALALLVEESLAVLDAWERSAGAAVT
jgi:HPt (histidine-containing phosphotransfer) domain-containing protein